MRNLNIQWEDAELSADAFKQARVDAFPEDDSYFMIYLLKARGSEVACRVFHHDGPMTPPYEVAWTLYYEGEASPQENWYSLEILATQFFLEGFLDGFEYSSGPIPASIIRSESWGF